MKYKTTEKDRYGNMRSLEITTDGQMEVPPMTSMIPQYDHPGEPKGSDTVPAWLTPGEFVVNKEAVDLYGPQIEKMNDVGREIQDMKPEYAAEGMEVPVLKYDAVTEAGLSRPKFNIEAADFSDINVFNKEINKTAMRYELDPEYLKAVLYTESLGNPNVIGDKTLKEKAYGLGQLRKNAYKDIKKDFPDYQFEWDTIKKNPIANIDATAKYLTMMRDKYVSNANKGMKGFEKNFIDNPNEQMNYMYQFYNAGPYKKNATAVMNANKVMEVKERLEGTDPSSDTNDNWFSSFIKSLKPKSNPLQKNMNTGGQVHHLDPGGFIPKDNDDLMKLVFDSQQLMNKVDTIPEMQELLNNNMSDDSSTMPNINNSNTFEVSPEEVIVPEILPYGTIDDMPQSRIDLDMSGPKLPEEIPEGYVEDIMTSIEGTPLPPAEPGYVEDGQVRFADKDLEEEVNRLLPFINKEVAGPDRDDLGTETKRAEVETVDSAASRLSEAAKKISNEAANAQQDALNTDDGKKALTDNTNTEDPKFKQVKGMLNFLFGDLIDGKELGRGVAIYLASRALGYDHNSTIGFVAKKYLTRVDAKNLAMDKFIKANASKYEKESLAEYKRTGNPSVLIPIGATARPTGEEKAYYNAAGQKRMAYKFKKKNAQGDDITYYSWDKAGGSLKARVDDNWTTDSSTVADTPEYNERMNKASTRIAKKIKELKESDQFDAYNRRKSSTGTVVNDYYTDILPENDSGAVARWAEANGFSAFQLDKGLQQAYTMAINEAKANPDVNISSLVPYLEEATIKQRLDSFKGVPRVSTAVVDGETITMEPKELVILNEKISNVMGGDTNRFWNEAAKVWKTKDPDSGKPWPEIFTPLGKQNNLPPFALFAQVMLDNKMEQMAGTQ